MKMINTSECERCKHGKFIKLCCDKAIDLEDALKKSEYSVDDVRECMKAALIEIGMEAELDENEEDSEEYVSDI